MPEGLPPALWDPATGVKTDEVVKGFIDLHKFKSEHDARLAAVPEKPEGYKLDLPQDFEIPAGIKITFDEKDPRLAAAREFAKANGLDQAAFSKMLAFDAMQTVAAYKSELANIEAEQGKLGEKFAEREQALTAFVKSALTGTAEQRAAKHKALQHVLTSAAAFEGLEDIINRLGGSKIPGSREEPPAAPQPRMLKDILYPTEKAS